MHNERRREGLSKGFENFCLYAPLSFLLALPLLMAFNDLMPLFRLFFQVTYKVNNKERFEEEEKRDVTKIDTSASRLIQIRYPSLSFPSLFC